MKSMVRNLGRAFFAASLFLSTSAGAVAIFSASGADPAAIQNTVDAFRAALGNPNNANAVGPLATGRREINWDGGGPPVINGTAPVTPFTVFRDIRGATFTTPGTGLTQAAATGGSLSLDLINPQYAALFAPFSANRLFTPIGSNITDVVFAIPGSGGSAPAGVSGFGAVFSDVDLAGTSITLINDDDELLGTFPVPTFSGNKTFSFLGIFTQASEGLITRVRITTGTSPLGPTETQFVDLVVMDDFLYAEPQRIQGVPEPATLLLLATALFGLAFSRRARVH